MLALHSSQKVALARTSRICFKVPQTFSDRLGQAEVRMRERCEGYSQPPWWPKLRISGVVEKQVKARASDQLRS